MDPSSLEAFKTRPRWGFEQLGVAESNSRSCLPLAPAAELHSATIQRHFNTISDLQRCLTTPWRSCLVLGKQIPLRVFSFSMAHRGSLAGSLLSGVFPVLYYMLWGTPSCSRCISKVFSVCQVFNSRLSKTNQLLPWPAGQL